MICRLFLSSQAAIVICRLFLYSQAADHGSFRDLRRDPEAAPPSPLPLSKRLRSVFLSSEAAVSFMALPCPRQRGRCRVRSFTFYGRALPWPLFARATVNARARPPPLEGRLPLGHGMATRLNRRQRGRRRPRACRLLECSTGLIRVRNPSPQAGRQASRTAGPSLSALPIGTHPHRNPSPLEPIPI